MAQKRNYDDFINFAKKNKNLSRTDIYWKYREQGGKIKKQTALDMLRDYTKVEKGKERKATVKTLLKEKKTRQKVTVTDHDYKSLESPIIQKLHKNIQELYRVDEDHKKFLKVGIRNDNDLFSTTKEFSIFIPTTKDHMGVIALSKAILKNMKTFYQNLAKKYNTKANMVGDTLSALSKTTADLNRITGLTQREMENTFEKNGFKITGYETFEFRN